MNEKNYYIVFGAQMVNKGAQAMLFVTVSEIRKREPNAKIVVFIYDKWKSQENPDMYNMEFIPINMKQMMNLSNTILSKAYILAKRGRISKKNTRLLQIDYVLRHSKMAFDISGYALSNQWGIGGSLFYLSKFAMLHKYNVPIYVMPQSFGPFDYHSKLKNYFMKHYIKKYLNYVDKIFVREREGYKCLKDELKLNNIELSNDLVLQNSSIDLNAIYKKIPKFMDIEIQNNNNVAIIPNSSNNKYGDKTSILRLYSDMVSKLQKIGKSIYLLSHSSQDMEMCNEILDNVNNKEKIKIIEADLNCIEYSTIIKKFDYIIASRFHSIVNAFKVSTPCISLGWAQKYEELLGLLGQEEFHFDVRQPENFPKLLNSIELMENNFVENSKIIKGKLIDIQKKSCFNFLDDVIGKKKSFKRNVENFVSKEGLCTGCGICKAICPKKCINYQIDKGNFNPIVKNVECINCGLCIKNCPGKGYDYQNAWKENIPEKKLIGNYLKICRAQALNKDILKESTSGGCITTIVKEMLSKGKYDVAFLVKNDNFKNQVFSTIISDVDDIRGSQKSKYVPVAQTKAIEYIINNPQKRIVFVGVPCFVHGLLNVIDNYNLDRNKYLILGLFCDRALNYNIWDYFSKEYCDNSLKKMYFRDKENSGWPGNVTCYKENDEKINLPAFVRTDVKDFFQIESCLYCLDKLNQFADISFGDDYANRLDSQNKNGFNSIIVRTIEGLNVLNACSDELVVENQKEEEIYQSQNLQLKNKNFTFLTLKASVANENTGFSDFTISKEAITEYENKLYKINLGEKSDFKKIREKVNKSKKNVFLKKIKNRIKRIVASN